MTIPAITLPEALKPCPFCGGEAYTGRSVFFVRCSQCGCTTDDFREKARAIEAWNRRALPSAELRALSEAAPPFPWDGFISRTPGDVYDAYKLSFGYIIRHDASPEEHAEALKKLDALRDFAVTSAVYVRAMLGGEK